MRECRKVALHSVLVALLKMSVMEDKITVSQSNVEATGDAEFHTDPPPLVTFQNILSTFDMSGSSSSGIISRGSRGSSLTKDSDVTVVGYLVRKRTLSRKLLFFDMVEHRDGQPVQRTAPCLEVSCYKLQGENTETETPC